MLAIKQEALTNSFLGFADNASNILHIKSETAYEEALEIIEHLFDKANDTADEPLNDLIDIISKSIEKYESSLEGIVIFDNEANNIKQEISALRVLMEQHNLTISGFQDEIGSKSLVSMILNGKRNLTKEHITKLSKRFSLSPAVFFN
ncbi:MAG: helix-turn-helix domain-containing protein [Methylococcales bacterium]|nr:helix-turn-helix domain-containing protein [Methylococcales bacterium]